MSYEPRQFTRHAALGRPAAKAARIVAGAGQAVRTCSVANLSHTGATLRLGDGAMAESRFALLIDGEPGPRQCQLVWTAPAELGVRFLHPDESTVRSSHYTAWG